MHIDLPVSFISGFQIYTLKITFRKLSYINSSNTRELFISRFSNREEFEEEVRDLKSLLDTAFKEMIKVPEDQGEIVGHHKPEGMFIYSCAGNLSVIKLF